jgi:FkbM family methyltransferase
MISGLVDLARVGKRFGFSTAVKASVNRLLKSPSIEFSIGGRVLYLPNEPYALRHLLDSVPKIQSLIAAIPDENIEIIFDIGANAGIFSALARSRWPHARIFAFEASPSMCKFIKKNISDQNFEVIDRAVSNRDGEKIDFFIRNDAQQTNSTIREAVTQFGSENNQNQVLTVQTVTVDDFCARKNLNKIDVLKVDIQGGESSMLEGSKRMLPYIRHLLIETSYLDPDPLRLLQTLYGAYRSARAVNFVVSGADMHFYDPK